MNLVMTGGGKYVEIQGTAEKTAFSAAQLNEMLALGAAGISQLVQKQSAVIGSRADLKRVLPLR
jgi:ribonuclease PH